MAGYGSGTRRLGGIPSGFPTDPAEAALLNMRYVDEMVLDMSDYKSLKLIKLCGGLDKGGPWTAGKIEWMRDDLYRRTDTLTTSLATGVTTLPITGKGHRYPKGTVLELVEAVTPTYARELVLITTQHADTPTIVRGFGPTSDPGTTYASGTKFRVAGFAHSESKTWTAIQTSLKALDYNYPSIIAFSVQSTFRNAGIARYGQGGLGKDFDEQVAKAVKRATIELEQGLLLGRTNPGSSTDDDPSMMGGLLERVDSTWDANVVETDKSGDPLTLKDINDSLQATAEIVGEENVARTLLTGYWGHRKLNSFFEPSVRLERTTNDVGLIVQRIETVIGTVEIVSDTHMPEGVILFLAPEQVSMGPMAGYGRMFIGDNPARTGDFFERFVYADYSAMIKNPMTMAKIVNFATDS
jgi:hypothetical protein